MFLDKFVCLFSPVPRCTSITDNHELSVVSRQVDHESSSHTGDVQSQQQASSNSHVLYKVNVDTAECRTCVATKRETKGLARDENFQVFAFQRWPVTMTTDVRKSNRACVTGEEKFHSADAFIANGIDVIAINTNN